MRIAIDASRSGGATPTGTETYSRRLIGALIQANRARPQPHQLTLYFRDRATAEQFPQTDSVNRRVIPFPRLWTHFRFALELWKTRPDAAFVPAHCLPFCFPGKAVFTAHDLGYRHFPDAHPLRQRTYLEQTTRFSQARASLILADSQATAADLRRFYQTPARKIRVLYPGVDAPTIGDVSALRAKYNLPERYFVFIGTLQPRKNIQTIAKAFAHWRSETDDRETGLVLAGGQGWLYDARWLAGVENARTLGYIAERDKGALLAGALALVFPSLHEGFGFPVIEAMHCGAPVIASDTSSLPELAGEAALLVDPLDVHALSRAMGQIAEDESLRLKLIERGRKRAKAFTWPRAGQQLLDILDEIDAYG